MAREKKFRLLSVFEAHRLRRSVLTIVLFDCLPLKIAKPFKKPFLLVFFGVGGGGRRIARIRKSEPMGLAIFGGGYDLKLIIVTCFARVNAVMIRYM